MPRTRVLLALPFAVVASACAEPLAPTSPIVSAGLSASVDRGEHAAPVDVHAVHVNIRSMVFGAVVVDRYSFHVHGRPGEMKGKFTLSQVRMVEGKENAVVVASGTMDCATIVGDKARAGGTITESGFPEGLPVGAQLTWTVTDGGQGRRGLDTASQPLGNSAELHCAGQSYDYPEQWVSGGHVSVKQ